MSDFTQMPKLDIGIEIPAVLSQAPNVRFAVLDEQRRYVLRVKRTHLQTFAASMTFELPTKIGGTILRDGLGVYCLGPDEWQINADLNIDVASKFDNAPEPFSLVDISHRNVGLTIEGIRAAKLINTSCPLDLSMDAFPVGKVTRTIFERAEITLYRGGESHFGMEFWRSFSPYIMGLLGKSVA